MMNKSVGFVVAAVMAGCASLAAAQFGVEQNRLVGSTGFNAQTLRQPAIEPVPPMVNPPVDPPSTVANVPLTNCDSAGCWDAAGTRYTRAGNTLIGSNGKICSIVAPGAPAMCN
jgi:hypothetical protein